MPTKLKRVQVTPRPGDYDRLRARAKELGMSPSALAASLLHLALAGHPVHEAATETT